MVSRQIYMVQKRRFYSTGYGNYSIKCLFIVYLTTILHENYIRNTCAKQACEKIDKKVQAIFGN